jgi:hypothetical protein
VWNKPSVLWIPDIRNDDSPLVEAWLRSLDDAQIGRITQSRYFISIKQEVGLIVDSISLLQDDYSLYAFPLRKIPPEHLLDDLESEKLHALGIDFFEKDYTGYLDLYRCDLFVQGPFWQFSWFPWLKREPALATIPYAYVLLVAGKEMMPLECDGSETRECLFCGEYDGEVNEAIHRFIFHAACSMIGIVCVKQYANPILETIRWIHPGST